MANGHSFYIVLVAMTLSACATGNADRAASVAEALEQPEGANEVAENESGLGTIAYTQQREKKCGRQARTGSRIQREICTPDGFNGLYPAPKINMGTANESQPGYGNNR